MVREATNPEEVGESYLLDFYGTECPHCKDMEPLVEKLEAEEGVEVVKLEVWHNAENAQYLQSLDKGSCGGVPFFYNLKNNSKFCGSVPYEKLKEWALSAENVPEGEHGTDASPMEAPAESATEEPQE